MSKTAQLDELLLRWQELRQQGQSLSVDQLCSDCPELADEVKRQVQALLSMEDLLEVPETVDGSVSEASHEELLLNTPQVAGEPSTVGPARGQPGEASTTAAEGTTS